MLDIRYDYWLKITDAIEKYIKEQGEEHFKFDAMNFDNAFARKYYFLILSKTLIRDKIINALATNTNNLTIILTNRAIRRILTLMYPNIEFNFVENLNVPIIYKNINTRQIVYNSNKIKEYSYIFVIEQTKFIRYFAPIYKKLPKSCFLLINSPVGSIDLCELNSFEYICVNYSYTFTSLNDDIGSLVNDYLMALEVLAKIEPKKIIIPEGNIPSGEIYNLAGKKTGIDTVCIQQGWSPVYHIGFRNMKYSNFLTWGKKFSFLLQKYNTEQKFTVVGSHILNKTATSGNAIGVFLQHYSGTTLFDKKEYDEFIEFIYESAKKHEHKIFIIRKHPGYELEEYVVQKFESLNNIVYMPPELFRLDEILEKINISISIYSTVLIESLAYSIVPFIFNNTPMLHYEPNLAIDNLAVEVKNITEGIIKLSRLIEDKEYFDFFINTGKITKNDYFHCSANNAIDNIITNIIGAYNILNLSK